jgi:hypothetical protein
MNLSSLAASVGSKPFIFAAIVGSKSPLFAGPGATVCRPQLLPVVEEKRRPGILHADPKPHSDLHHSATVALRWARLCASAMGMYVGNVSSSTRSCRSGTTKVPRSTRITVRLWPSTQKRASLPLQKIFRYFGGFTTIYVT